MALHLHPMTIPCDIWSRLPPDDPWIHRCLVFNPSQVPGWQFHVRWKSLIKPDGLKNSFKRFWRETQLSVGKSWSNHKNKPFFGKLIWPSGSKPHPYPSIKSKKSDHEKITKHYSVVFQAPIAIPSSPASAPLPLHHRAVLRYEATR